MDLRTVVDREAVVDGPSCQGDEILIRSAINTLKQSCGKFQYEVRNTII